jgi:hypothetical protein
MFLMWAEALPDLIISCTRPALTDVWSAAWGLIAGVLNCLVAISDPASPAYQPPEPANQITYEEDILLGFSVLATVLPLNAQPWNRADANKEVMRGARALPARRTALLALGRTVAARQLPTGIKHALHWSDSERRFTHAEPPCLARPKEPLPQAPPVVIVQPPVVAPSLPSAQPLTLPSLSQQQQQRPEDEPPSLKRRELMPSPPPLPPPPSQASSQPKEPFVAFIIPFPFVATAPPPVSDIEPGHHQPFGWLCRALATTVSSTLSPPHTLPASSGVCAANATPRFLANASPGLRSHLKSKSPIITPLFK